MQAPMVGSGNVFMQQMGGLQGQGSMQGIGMDQDTMSGVSGTGDIQKGYSPILNQSVSTVNMQQVQQTKAALDSLDIDAALDGEKGPEADVEVIVGQNPSILTAIASADGVGEGKGKRDSKQAPADETSPVVFVEEMASISLGAAEQSLPEKSAAFFDVWGAIEKGAYSLEKLPVPRQAPARRDRVF